MRNSLYVENLVADLRGLPHRHTRSNDREVSSLQGLMAKLQETYELQEPKIEAVIMQHWRYIMGSSFAQRCYPEKITNDNTMQVRVGNAALLSELEFRKRDILKRIQSIPECREIHAIKLVRGC